MLIPILIAAVAGFIVGVIYSNSVKAFAEKQEAKAESLLSDEQKKALSAINDAKEKLKATL